MYAKLLVLLFLGSGVRRVTVQAGQYVTSPFDRRCHNSCSGHGVCATINTTACKCFPDFTGPDCSLRLCPASTAWVDFPRENNRAHYEFTECSNMGLCDRATGLCKCRAGFTGAACDQMLCPVGELATDSIAYPTLSISNVLAPCSGNGRCMSLRQLTQYQDYDKYYGYTPYTQNWDADKMHGCVCDSGWEGVACSKRSCPFGDDPSTTDHQMTQLIDCQCANCAGGFYLTFEGYQTPFIPYNSPAEVIAWHLRRIPGVREVEVVFLTTPLTASGKMPFEMCTATGTVAKVTITIPTTSRAALVLTRAIQGGKPGTLTGLNIGVKANNARSNIVRTAFSEAGSKEYVECSNKGKCDHDSGTCQCYSGYVSSDGQGHRGNRGDCGFQLSELSNQTVVTLVTNSSTNVTEVVSTVIETNCPFEWNAVCSGNGTCTSSGHCACNAGYGGPACSNRTCAVSTAWFGNVLANHSGTAVCGGVGECDGGTGLCKDCGGAWQYFSGTGCEALSCDGDSGGASCSGNGVCLSLQELALLAYNDRKELAGVTYTEWWDANKVRGCACDRAISVDNQYYENYTSFVDSVSYNVSTREITTQYDDLARERFYRGPFAFAATDFTGYNCVNAMCPKGDNPRSHLSNYSNEIQALKCRADNGTFTLEFRQNKTLPIPWDATAFELQGYLEQIFTIGRVRVTFGDYTSALTLNTSVCAVFQNYTAYIEFLTETGDLPLLTFDVTNLQAIHNFAEKAFWGDQRVMNITEVQKGTKEDVECSGQGTCSEATGQCACFAGYQSSNGTTYGAGDKGDCSFLNPSGYNRK